MNRATWIFAIVMLLLAVVVGTVGGLLIDAGRDDAWPTACAQTADGATTCSFVTITPRPTWEAATVEAVATWLAVRADE